MSEGSEITNNLQHLTPGLLLFMMPCIERIYAVIRDMLRSADLCLLLMKLHPACRHADEGLEESD